MTGDGTKIGNEMTRQDVLETVTVTFFVFLIPFVGIIGVGTGVTVVWLMLKTAGLVHE